MGEGSDQIARKIEQKRDELGNDLGELERKVKDATNWRRQFQRHPATLMGLAFGGGLLLSRLWGSNRRARAERPLSSAHRRTSTLWNAVKGPLISLAAAKIQRSLR